MSHPPVHDGVICLMALWHPNTSPRTEFETFSSAPLCSRRAIVSALPVAAACMRGVNPFLDRWSSFAPSFISALQIPGMPLAADKESGVSPFYNNERQLITKIRGTSSQKPRLAEFCSSTSAPFRTIIRTAAAVRSPIAACFTSVPLSYM